MELQYSPQTKFYFYPRSPCGERRCGFRRNCARLPFLSTLSLRRATNPIVPLMTLQGFLSTLSLRRATAHAQADANNHGFLSTLSLRRATELRRYRHSGCTFLSTLSLRRATVIHAKSHECATFLSTLSLRRATWSVITLLNLTPGFLSTLSLRRATPEKHRQTSYRPISIHALLAESDPRLFPSSVLICVFLSTLSLRRATCIRCPAAQPAAHFYPRSPCGERRYPGLRSGQDIPISIHALLAESDFMPSCKAISLSRFLSTLSLRRATFNGREAFAALLFISIHALLAESDQFCRSPQGERG